MKPSVPANAERAAASRVGIAQLFGAALLGLLGFAVRAAVYRGRLGRFAWGIVTTFVIASIIGGVLTALLSGERKSFRGLLTGIADYQDERLENAKATQRAELIEDRPELVAAVGPLLKAREAIEQQIADFDRKVMRLARGDAQVRRFMTTPGVGAITALCFLATIDDPTRFKRSRSVGAYAGLTTRRYASGEIDWTGRISKCGDAMLRSYLYEAANVLLTRVAKWSALKAWGIRLAKRSGLRKAKVAVARKLAVILHRMWVDGTEFNWSSKEVVAQSA